MRRLSNSIGTVDKLKQALFSCLNEQEYCDITIAGLCRCAGINRTTFYLFFSTKDELFVQLCSSVLDLWFQRFFDLNIAKNVDAEKELFHRLLAWIQQWRFALKRIPRVRTESFDGFSLLTDEIERKMAEQGVFRTDDEKKRKKYDLFIRVYSVGLVSILRWLLDEGDGFEENEFHSMIECLRYRGYYGILDD